jgi:hypothetical protein
MARTYFHVAKRDDGTLITVEYSATGGEPHYDNPGHICDGGGSGPDICIVKAFVEDDSTLDDAPNVQLTDAESERIESEIAEGYEDDYDDE